MTSYQIHTCIIPAAGSGTRWHPFSKTIPKELLPLANKPVIEWIIEEIISSGYKQIVVVISHDKLLIKKYLNEQKHLLKKIKINYVYQDKKRGILDTIFLSEKFINGNLYSLLLPDVPSVYQKVPTLFQLNKVANLSETAPILCSLARYPKRNTIKYTKCKVSPYSQNYHLLNIKQLQHTTKFHPNKNTLMLAGRYIFHRSTLPTIHRLLKTNPSGEVNDRHLINDALNLGQTVFGKEVTSCNIYDTGNPIDYAKAVPNFVKLRK